MKKKAMVISTIALLIIVLGSSMAWFSHGELVVNKFKTGTVKVEVLEPEFIDISHVEVGTYTKNVKAISKGTKRTYVRVKLIPEWSEPSLPVSNVVFNLASNNDWIDGGDGYYYFKYYLTTNQETSLLLQSVTFTSLGPEYEGQTLKIKVVAEGVQITHNAWKDVWGRDTLPFPLEQPWTP